MLANYHDLTLADNFDYLLGVKPHKKFLDLSIIQFTLNLYSLH